MALVSGCDKLCDCYSEGCRRLGAHPGGTREVRAESRGHLLEASEIHHLEGTHLLAGKGMVLLVMVLTLVLYHLLMGLMRSLHQVRIKEI